MQHIFAAPIPDDKITPTLITVESIHGDKNKVCFFKINGGHMSIFGATDTPALDFW